MEKRFGDFNGILIIGLGLIGGSLALNLKREGFKGKIFALDLSEKRIRYAEERGIIDKGYTDLKDIPWEDIDLVVIATPLKTFTNIAEVLKNYLKDGTIITDVGSVKGKLVKKLEDIFKPFKFIGGHPIAGTEKEGVENAVKDLFKGKKFIISTNYDKDDRDIKRIEGLWRDLGSKIEYMEPSKHDFIFASVSHLPHAVAFAMINSVVELSDKSEIDLFLYPGAGFKDFTRIAASSPEVWKDIFLENKDNLVKTIDVYQKVLDDLKKLIQEGDEEGLREYISQSRDKRIKLDDQ